MPPIKELQSIFFPVRKVDRSIENPGMNYNSHLSHEIQVLPAHSKKWVVVNDCSEGYTLVPNEEIFIPTVEKLKASHDLEFKVSYYDLSKFYVDIVLKDLTFGGKKEKDMIFPRMRINNSYDGSVKYSYHFGFYRVVCSNGMMAAIKGKIRGEKLMHTPYAADERALKQTLKDLDLFLDDAKEIYKGYNVLKEKKYTFNEALKRVEELFIQVDDFPRTLKENVVSRLQVEANMKFDPSDYLVYNAMNYALYQNGDSEMKTHKRDKLDLKVMDYLLTNH